jgi:VanZ family protein
MIIVFLTLFPGKEMPDMSIWDMFSFDKAAHIFVFSILVLLMIVGFTKQYQYAALRKHAVRYALMISILLGFLIEILQSILISSRSFEFLDLLADIFGSLLGFVLFYIIYKFDFGFDESR